MKLFGQFFLWAALLFANTLAMAQTAANLRTVNRLPTQLVESSGLYAPSPDSIWSHGDSGNAPNLYLIDTTCTVRRTVNVRGVPNIDWEELGADTRGNVYVCDFGNNDCVRRDLVIYKVLNFRALRTDTVDAQQIQFSYEDQTVFPPAKPAFLFNCEAMLPFDDSLFVCIKDYDAVPYPGITRIYSIPNAPGTYSAKFVAQHATDASDKQLGGITGMAMSTDRRRVLLTTHSKLYIAQNFPGRNFWAALWQGAQYSPVVAKREAITFRDSCNVFVSEDVGSGTPGNLYLLNVCDWVRTPTNEINDANDKMRCFPNPLTASTDLRVDFHEAMQKNTVLEVINELGQKVGFVQLPQGTQNYTIPARYFPTNGVYYLRLAGENTSLRVVRVD